MPGFVRVTGASELAFPDYDGNGMFKSLGNALVNPNVGCCSSHRDKPRRLRVNGRAASDADRSIPVRRADAGAGCSAGHLSELSALYSRHAVDPVDVFAAPGYEPPEPAWKGFDAFKDVRASASADLERLAGRAKAERRPFFPLPLRERVPSECISMSEAGEGSGSRELTPHPARLAFAPHSPPSPARGEGSQIAAPFRTPLRRAAFRLIFLSMPPPFLPPIARLRVLPDDPAAVVAPRPRGSYRPHTDATVAAVRRLDRADHA